MQTEWMTPATTEPGAPTALEVEHLLLDGVPVPCSELEHMHMPGLYAWWDLDGALHGLWPDGLAPVSTARPIYVGQARTSFADRATKMHLRTSRLSTLRRSLASLLADRLDLADGARLARRHPAMFSLRPDGEERLTAWMRAPHRDDRRAPGAAARGGRSHRSDRRSAERQVRSPRPVLAAHAAAPSRVPCTDRGERLSASHSAEARSSGPIEPIRCVRSR